jgi:hypothetical protein
MRIIYTIIWTLTIIPAIGQISRTQEKELKKLIRESIEEYSLTSRWKALNRDSAFYKSDTVTFFNHTNYSVDNGCYYVIWKFYRPTEFVWSNSSVCKEPPTETAYINMTTLQFKRDNEDKLFLTTRREGKEQDKFELIEIGRSIMFSGQESNFIKLVRVRKTSR